MTLKRLRLEHAPARSHTDGADLERAHLGGQVPVLQGQREGGDAVDDLHARRAADAQIPREILRVGKLGIRVRALGATDLDVEHELPPDAHGLGREVGPHGDVLR